MKLNPQGNKLLRRVFLVLSMVALYLAFGAVVSVFFHVNFLVAAGVAFLFQYVAEELRSTLSAW